MEQIFHVQLLAKKESTYSLYVFKNLIDNSLIMCTKLPNWNLPFIEIGDKGFIKISTVIAGQSYFNVNDESWQTYKYSNIYLTNYIKEPDNLDLNIIL